MESPQRIRSGRPKTLDIDNSDMKEYRKEYYQRNKDKYKGDCICNICNAIYCKSNKSRHMKSPHHLKHLQILSEKINLLIN